LPSGGTGAWAEGEGDAEDGHLSGDATSHAGRPVYDPLAGISLEGQGGAGGEASLEALSCPICLATLVEPLRLQCGHAFCRRCLHLSLHMSPEGERCPMCRAPVRRLNKQGGKGIDALSAPVDEELVQALTHLLPEGEYAQRARESRIALEELVGGGKSVSLPVYHVGRTALQPGDVTHLHLFENRYKALIRRAIDGTRLFLFSEGPPRMGDSATIALVERCSILQGGKADVICRGVERVSISAVWADEEVTGLLCARCTSAIAAPLVMGPTDADTRGASLWGSSPASADTRELLQGAIAREGWLTEGREGELIDLPVVCVPPEDARPALGARTTMLLTEQRYRVVAQRMMSSPQLFILAHETPEAGNTATVALVLRCKFRPNGSAKVIARAVEEVLLLQVRWEQWAGRLHYARCRVCSEETRKTISSFRSALWSSGGTPPGITDHLAGEDVPVCKCSVS